jgi:hypothetical protein
MRAADAPRSVASHAIWHEMHHELHQAFAIRRPARIEPSLVDGADHWALWQEPGAGLGEGLYKTVERRSADMDVPSLVGADTGAVGHRAIEREIDTEERLAPSVALDLVGNAFADLRLAKKIEHEMAGIDIGGEYAVKRDDLSSLEAD